MGVFLGHRHGHAVERLGDGHAGKDAHVVAVTRTGLDDVVDVGSGLCVGDATEVEGHGRGPRSALGLHHDLDQLAVHGISGHGSTVDGGEHEGKLIAGDPVAARDGLLAGKGGLA